jgi:aminoglycoside phosphotransferase (APT) family kinase protein
MAGDEQLGESLGERLAAWLSTPGVAPGLPGPVVVTGMDRLSGGASRQTWSVDVNAGGSSRRIVVQRKRPGGLGAGMVLEASLIRHARDAGVPVATVLADTNDVTLIGGEAMVVDYLPGESVASRLLRQPEFANARAVLAAQAAAALAAIGAMDPNAVAGLRHDDQLDGVAALHRGMDRAQPVFELALRWLQAHRPDPPEHLRVVHGDYRLGNFLVDGDGLVAVLDWELAHLGDTAEDLAWACVKAWRFQGAGAALGLADIDQWVDAYVAAGGERPGQDRLRWWLVFGTLRWGVICELQAAAHLTGMVDSVELAVLGRRVAETEHDLLGLLGLLAETEGSDLQVDAGSGPDGAPHDAPNVDELLAVVERFLSSTVTDATTGQVRFHARVAANAVGMVRRQVADGGRAAQAHRQRLGDLGVADDAELASRIADGQFDHRLAEVGSALAAAVGDKLAVAAPDYVRGVPADPWL